MKKNLIKRWGKNKLIELSICIRKSSIFACQNLTRVYKTQIISTIVVCFRSIALLKNKTTINVDNSFILKKSFFLR